MTPSRSDSRATPDKGDERTTEELGRTASAIREGRELWVSCDAGFRVVRANAEAERLHPDPSGGATVVGHRFWDLLPGVSGTEAEDRCRRAMQQGVAARFEMFHEPWGRWYDIGVEPSAGGELEIFLRDITVGRQTSAILDGQKRALELAMNGAPPADALEILVRTMEIEDPHGLTAAIHLLDPDGLQLRHGAAPSLPDGWSTPIVSRAGAILGRFALHYRVARSPSAHEQEVAAQLARTAAIILDHDRETRAHLAAERRLAAAKDDLALQVAGLRRLHRLAMRLAGQNDLVPALEAIVTATCEIHGTERGLISLLDPTAGQLDVAAARGFERSELDSAGRAMLGPWPDASLLRAEPRIVVEDVETDPHVGDDARAAARAIGARAIHSIPVVTRQGDMVGVLSVLFREPRRPTPLETQLADLCARTVAQSIEADRSHRSLRISERRYRELVEDLPAAVYVCDADGRILLWNRAAEVLWGRTPQVGVDRFNGAHRLLTPDGAPLPLDRSPMAEALRTGRTPGGVDLAIERPDGTRSYVVAHPKPERDDTGAIVGALSILIDVTETRVSEIALRESEEKFHDLADNISQLAWMADEKGSIFWYNQRWFDYTGTTFEQLQGWGWTRCHHPDHVDRVVERIQRSWDTGEAWEDTFPLRSRDGAYRWFLSRARPIRGKDGQIVRWFGTNTDVTELREVQAALARAKEEAELANRSKDEFLAMLGHELRNPLAPILTALELAGLRGEDTLRDRGVIERQVAHLVRLVDDLLDVSRITRGRIELRRDVVELAEVVTRAIEMCGPLIDEKRHRLEMAIARDGLTVHGDRVRLAQVVANLLTNAAKYTDPSGTIRVSAARMGDQVVLRVRDTGIGLAPETLPRVFELFSQEYQALDRAKGGLGLGLAIVRSLVGLHGGTVEAHSDGPGTGSEFVVRLPWYSPEAQARPAPVTLPRAPAAIRALVVDDNTDAAELLAEVLCAMGHHAESAHDGPSALRMATALRPDVALLDIGLPVMDGYELARRLRTVPELSEVRLIAVTGYGQDSDRRRTSEAGFHGHLTKPVSVDALARLIDRLCSPRRSRDPLAT